MSTAIAPSETPPIVLHLGAVLERMTDREFFEFCQLNQDWRIERTAHGDLLIMPPTGGETGRRNFLTTGLFFAWAEADGSGIGFDSSTGFTLPNGAKRSPDLAWVRRPRWEALTAQQREEFPPLCPDFVVEIRSRTDELMTLTAKMDEYVANGAQLGWLIDPIESEVHVYRPGGQITVLERPDTVAGDPVLPGFVLDARRLWE
jgi:Uma2 family endonuclease